ncbi:MAG TPA: FecR domain-containing protein [Bacteroidales bacterium]|nr:FecR domain-containing protein [Bacteroidales bacterium]
MEKTGFVNEEINLLIVSHLTGSISEEDLVVLNNWINENIENRSYFNKLKDSWILSGVKDQDSLSQTAETWNTFKDKLTQNRFRLVLGNELRSRRKASITKYVKLAASWLLIFGLGSALTWWITGGSKDKLTSTETVNGLIEITTPLGARSIIKMPDSSQIWLNAGTTITYSQDYGQHSRTLNLIGEAYFKVAKNIDLPLIVNAGNINIRATGTEFNVKAYSDEGIIETTLIKGKVEISQKGDNDKSKMLELTPNQKAIYVKESDQITLRKIKEIEPMAVKPAKLVTDKLLVSPKVDVDQVTAWTQNKLIIRGENLEDLCVKLQRKYNVTFIFGNNDIKEYRFSGILLDETLEQVLNVIRLTAPVDYFLDGKNVLMLSNKEQIVKYSKPTKKYKN